MVTRSIICYLALCLSTWQSVYAQRVNDSEQVDHLYKSERHELGWATFNWREWSGHPPALRLRRTPDLLRSTPQQSDLPRFIIGSLELPSRSDLWELWARLQEIPRDPMRVMIIGDSLSATEHYLQCFKERSPRGPQVTTEQEGLIELWRAHGAQGVLSRDSYAAQPGATTWRLTQSRPLRAKRSYGGTRAPLSHPSKTVRATLKTPLLREIYENPARFAIITLGTNDLHYHRGAERFSAHYLQIVETLLDAGVLPLLSTIPARLDKAQAFKSQVREVNLIIKAIAQSKRLPLLRLHKELSTLKRQGLRSDGIHLNAYQGGCQLNQRGLRFGQNLRNQLTLNALTVLHELLAVTPSQRLTCGVNNTARLTWSRRSSRGLNLARWRSLTHGAKHAHREHRVSEVSNYTQMARESQCLHKVQRRALSAPQWRLMLAEPDHLIGPPRAEYGTWRARDHRLSLQRDQALTLLVLGGLGRKTDLRREQFWVALADGSCLKLQTGLQRLLLPAGDHTLLHYARLGETINPPKFAHHNRSGPFTSRAVFSWGGVSHR